MEAKKIVILGSTGSIGEQTLEIVRAHSDKFKIVALSCLSSIEILVEQINEFHPDYALICDESCRNEVIDSVKHDDTKIMAGSGHLVELAALQEADIILNAVVGFAGFESTVAALRAGKRVALANKESLVSGGALIDNLLESHSGKLIPIDSEHSALFQCLIGEKHKNVEKLILTASGGPFRTWTRKQMRGITVKQALDHPNWAMGSKITVDSATMMNKGLEVIEAHWLFGLPLQKIEAVIHPQSVVHSIVTFVDGSSKAQLGVPTMKVPILYALTYPERIKLQEQRLNWSHGINLTFEPVNTEKFPCFKLALNALETGGTAPIVLNAANEVAVNRFLDGGISYIQIPAIIEECLSAIDNPFEKTVEVIKQIDRDARNMALTL